MDLSYIINQLGEDRENYFNAVSPPIMQTSNFSFDTVEDLRNAMQDESAQPLYTRGVNPTVEILRKKIAALDGAEDALICSSGVTAIFLPVLANLKSGDHVICVDKPYSWTKKQFADLFPGFNIQCTFIDGTKIQNFEKAIRPETRIIFLESPNSMTYELQDLKAVAALAKSKGIITIIDNSYCSPMYQRPIEMGIDISVQTATKFIGGHSDAVGGVISGSAAMIKKIFASEFLNVGGIISPLNAWLFIRGLRTLEIRLERISSSTLKIVNHLASHPKIEKMIYPFHPSFPQYELAREQMKQGGGLFSVVLKANSVSQIETFCNALKRFLMAVSWGGHESLVFPVAATLKKGAYDPQTPGHNLVRFYIGLEDPEVLIEDIENALRLI